MHPWNLEVKNKGEALYINLEKVSEGDGLHINLWDKPVDEMAGPLLSPSGWSPSSTAFKLECPLQLGEWPVAGRRRC